MKRGAYSKGQAKAVTVPIFKKGGDRKKCRYREITLLCTLVKMFEGLNTEELGQW